MNVCMSVEFGRVGSGKCWGGAYIHSGGIDMGMSG